MNRYTHIAVDSMRADCMPSTRLEMALLISSMNAVGRGFDV